MNGAAAWSDFWANNAGASRGGCLPQRWAGIEEAQRDAWRAFITDMPEAAALLDLATGDGRVLGWLLAERHDLVLTGIDLAPTLPAPPEGTETCGGVAMEKLPFAHDRFDAVVSQFGFEYGDVALTSAQIARVLVKGGKIGLMIHRGDGPILEHNLARRAAIDWVVEENRLADSLRAALDAPGAGPQVAAQVAAAVGVVGARKFGEGSPAWEIPEALRRAVLLGADAGSEFIRASIGEIEAQAANEKGRIASLERACGMADRRDDIIQAFAAQSLTLRACEDVCEPSGRPFAAFLTFS